LFRVYDDDGSGTISVRELVCIFKDQGMEIDRDQACDYFRLVGVDPDNSDLRWIEYLDVMRSLNPLKTAQFRRRWYEPAKKHPEWSRAEIRVFIQAFRDFDLDDSGTIDKNELAAALLAMGQGSSQKKVDELMAKYGNESGVIEWPEFLDMLSSFYPDQMNDFQNNFLGPAKKYSNLFSDDDVNALIESFQENDDDADRALSVRELGTILTSMGQGCSETKMIQIMSDFDQDRSGTIDFSEFLNIIGSFYGSSTPSSGASKTTTTPATKTTTTTPAPKPTTTTTPAPKPTTSTPTSTPTKTTTTTTTPAPKPTPAPAQTTPKPAVATTTTPSKPSSTTPSSGSKIGGTNQCPGCGKTVYAAEKMTGVNNEWWHKLCFKCAKCGSLMTAGNWSEHEGKIYCKKDYQIGFSNQGYGSGRVQSFKT